MTTQTWATKPHYDILDGLRGIAAIMVLCYHICEAVAFAPINTTIAEQGLYHGFMAVDFFFILSGFVMGYAYEERLQDGSMSLGSFIKRRLIRLHPMVVIGVVIGLICFCIQGCQMWDGTQALTSDIMICVMLALFCLPTPTSMDVRGNAEAFPINGPHWSLFLEYIGSLCYGLFLFRVSTKILKIWVGISALLLLAFALWMGENYISYGWSSEPINMLGGVIRISFGYPMGLLLARLFKKKSPSSIQGPQVFWSCAIALLVIFLVPGLGDFSCYYQVFCLIILFPIIIWSGARGVVQGNSKKYITFLGRLSYPLYAVHYPLIYLYIYWIKQVDPQGALFYGGATVVILANLLLGTLCLICYDEPIRKWLSNKLG